MSICYSEPSLQMDVCRARLPVPTQAVAIQLRLSHDKQEVMEQRNTACSQRSVRTGWREQMFPVAVTEERSLITRAMGENLSFHPLCFSFAEGITLEG